MKLPLVACLALLACGAAAAHPVSLQGMLGAKALLIVNGGEPTLSVGEMVLERRY